MQIAIQIKLNRNTHINININLKSNININLAINRNINMNINLCSDLAAYIYIWKDSKVCLLADWQRGIGGCEVAKNAKGWQCKRLN